MKYLLLLFICINYIYCLPITANDSNDIQVKNDYVIERQGVYSQQEKEDIDEEYFLLMKDEIDDSIPFSVQVDRLAQIITTHIQFDHLDTVIINTDNFIATEFQHHLEINVLVNEDQQVIHQLSALDTMDLEILKSQIFAAIHAHTEGNLPLVWDIDKLSKQAIESFIRQILISTCGTTENTDTITSICLEDNAANLANQLDNYIQQSLDHVFELLDKETLPNLLKHTATDLKGILNYFNSAFLQDGSRKFVLQVVPWNSDPNDIHNFKSKLLDLAVHSSDNSEKSHSSAFFIEYASMARV